jgi:hypothetical protein
MPEVELRLAQDLHATLCLGNALYTHITRVTTASPDIRMGAAYKTNGTTRLKFDWRPVNYPQTNTNGCDVDKPWIPNTFW